MSIAAESCHWQSDSQDNHHRRSDRFGCNAKASCFTIDVRCWLSLRLKSNVSRRFPFESLSVHLQDTTVCSLGSVLSAPDSMYTTFRPCPTAAGCTTAATTKLHLQQQGVLGLAHCHSRGSSQYHHQQHACKFYNSRSFLQQHSSNVKRQVGTCVWLRGDPQPHQTACSAFCCCPQVLPVFQFDACMLPH